MKSNMGTADRVVRVLVALILAWAWYTGRISGTLAIVLLVIAGVFILTSFIGFCPGLPAVRPLHPRQVGRGHHRLTMRLATLALATFLAIPSAALGQAGASEQPAPSPDGRRLAFIGTREGGERLFVIDVDGTHEREVVAAGLDGRMPAWRAADELLYAGDGADSGTVSAVSLDGGAPRIVTIVPGRSPRISPDGRRVLYLVGPWTSTALVVADTNGSNVRTLAGGRATAWNGAWSPDGKHVAYTYGDSSRRLQVHVVDADGTGDRAVTRTTSEQGSAQMPAWAPDGRRLAIQVNNHPAHSSAIWVLDLASDSIRELTPPGSAYLDESPAWFPDGRQLAFQSDRTGTMQVWIMNADGSSPRQLTGISAP